MLDITASGWDGGKNLLRKGEHLRKFNEMIVHSFPSDVVIYPLSDVHLGAAECNIDAWERLCGEILKQKNAYCILNGDLIQNSTRSSIANTFEDVMRPREQKARMVEILTPIRDRVLCLTSGNHERRSLKDADDDVTLDIACKLDLEDYYRENIAFLNIRVGQRKTEENHSHQSYRICVTHGAGGGIYTSASVLRNERFGNVIDGIDLLIVGHSHKGFVTRPSKLVVDTRNNVVVQRDYVVLSSVSWLEYGGYAAQKMLLPSAHSQPQKILLKCDPNREGKKVEVIW